MVVGTGLFTVRTWALDVPPPGVPLVTVILKVPLVVRSDARMEAVSWVVETKVVVRASPAKLTTEVGIKFVPFTVNVKVASPAFLEVGETEVVVGTGFAMVTVGDERILVRVPSSEDRD